MELELREKQEHYMCYILGSFRFDDNKTLHHPIKNQYSKYQLFIIKLLIKAQKLIADG